MAMHKALHPEIMLTDYMCHEEMEEEDLPSSNSALRYRFNDSKTT